MDSLDIRNLYAAYKSVYEDQQSLTEDVEYELDEAKAEEGKSDFEKKDIRGRRYVEKTQGKKGVENYDNAPVETRGSWVGAARRRAHNAQHNEEVDVYDLVLDHLLDEGYCDDAESAEVIMANMSEEWLEEILDEANRGERHYNLSPEDVYVRRTRASASDRRAAEQWKQHDSGRNALTAKMTRGTGGNEQGNPKVKRGNSVFYDRTASHDSKRGVKKRKGQKTAQMRGPNPNVANHYAVKGRED
jgi:hypothetical protein